MRESVKNVLLITLKLIQRAILEGVLSGFILFLKPKRKRVNNAGSISKCILIFSCLSEAEFEISRKTCNRA